MRYQIVRPRSAVRGDQLQDEIRAEGHVVTIGEDELDDGNVVIIITTDENAYTHEQVGNWIDAHHTPRADYGLPPMPATDAQMGSMTAAQLRDWVIAWTSDERERIRASRAATIAANLAKGWTLA